MIRIAFWFGVVYAFLIGVGIGLITLPPPSP